MNHKANLLCAFSPSLNSDLFYHIGTHLVISKAPLSVYSSESMSLKGSYSMAVYHLKKEMIKELYTHITHVLWMYMRVRGIMPTEATLNMLTHSA